MDCTYLAFSSLFWLLKALLHHISHSPIHTHAYTDGRDYHVGCQPAHKMETNIYTHSTHHSTHHWHSHQEQFGVKCLVQGHVNMLPGEDGNQTDDLLIGGWPFAPEQTATSNHAPVLDLTNVIKQNESNSDSEMSNFMGVVTYPLIYRWWEESRGGLAI